MGFGLRILVASMMSALFATVCLLTSLRPDWFEGLLGIDPDASNGSAERLLLISSSIAAGVCAAIAGFDWRRLQSLRVKGKAPHG